MSTFRVPELLSCAPVMIGAVASVVATEPFADKFPLVSVILPAVTASA